MTAALVDPVRHVASVSPDAPAVVFDGAVLSYSDLDDWVDDITAALAERGVSQGRRVAILLPNRPSNIAVVHAAARMGAVVVPLNQRLTAAELQWQIKDADPTLVVIDEADSSSDKVRQGATPVVIVDELVAVGRDRQPSDYGPEADSPQLIMYTSGTTGRPKGAMLSYGNMRWSAAASALRLGHRPGDRWLVPLPLCHIGGLAAVFRSALYGSSVELHSGFDARAVADSLCGGRVTQLSLVPTMLSRVLDEWGDSPPPEALRAVLVGGGWLPPELSKRALAAGLPVRPTYGLTEVASQLATASDGPITAEPGWVGPPLVCTAVRIAASGGGICPHDEVGEIQVRGPTVMLGYWRTGSEPDGIDADGWLRTGDRGRLDGSGNLRVSGRREDLIVTGGENVYPAEVEAVLDAHPAVALSCVVGVDDEEWGSIVAAAIEVSRGADPCDEELLSHCRESLAGYKVPRYLVRVTELPRTALGKVERSATRFIVEQTVGGSGAR